MVSDQTRTNLTKFPYSLLYLSLYFTHAASVSTVRLLSLFNQSSYFNTITFLHLCIHRPKTTLSPFVNKFILFYITPSHLEPSPLCPDCLCTTSIRPSHACMHSFSVSKHSLTVAVNKYSVCQGTRCTNHSHLFASASTGKYAGGMGNSRGMLLISFA